VAKAESTARLAREAGLSRQQLQTLRQRIQANLHETAPTAMMVGPAVEAAELYHNAGENKPPPRDPTAPPRRHAKKRNGPGTYAHEPPPLISLISRETGEQRWWVCEPAQTRPGAALSAENVPMGSTWLYTDAWQS
jgi:hypothetical protein